MSFPTTIYDSASKAKETYATQGEIPLGTRLVTPDGRIFRYAQAGATDLKPFKVVKQAAVNPWSTMSASTLNMVGRVTSYVAGATQIKFWYGATGAATANYFKDGYLVVQSSDTAGFVQMARLGAHAALASCTLLNSANIINIPDGLDLALSTETDMWPRLIPNPYKSVILTADTDLVGGALGVPICAVTATYYFWCQTWGPAPVLQDAGMRAISTLGPGWGVYLATGSTGGICAGSTGFVTATGWVLDTDSGRSAAMGSIGTLMQAAHVNTGYALVNLRLAA